MELPDGHMGSLARLNARRWFEIETSVTPSILVISETRLHWDC